MTKAELGHGVGIRRPLTGLGSWRIRVIEYAGFARFKQSNQDLQSATSERHGLVAFPQKELRRKQAERSERNFCWRQRLVRFVFRRMSLPYPDSERRV
jgi:hypothetical protein